MHVGVVIYGDLEQTSGGYRYDRKLVSGLEARGDEVTVISLPRPDRGKRNSDASVRDRLDRPFDVLLQDELCYPTLVDHNPRLEEPETIVALVHLLDAARPGGPESTGEGRGVARERRYLETVDGAVATSEYTRKRTLELASLPTAVAPPAGRREGAAVSLARVRERAREPPLRIAFVGNLVPRKNLPTLLEALARVDREWTLTVVGSPDADPATARAARRRVDRLGLGDRVSFAGEVVADELESILERSHVLAVPARYEGFGMVYLEAMEYVVVPIASAVGGADDLVADGRNGFLVDPDDRTRLAAVVDDLAVDRDTLARLGRRALETADAHPTWDETTQIVREFLRDRLAAGSTRESPDED